MSNRVRVLLRHPDIVPVRGGQAFKTIEQKFTALNTRRQHAWLQPAGFALWPRWKRCGWMAKKLGERWIYKVFREKRGEKASRSLFWKACSAAGLQPPRRKRPAKSAKLNVKHVKKQIAMVNGNRIYYANMPALGNNWIYDEFIGHAAVPPDEAPVQQAQAPRPGRLRPRNNPFGDR